MTAKTKKIMKKPIGALLASTILAGVPIESALSAQGIDQIFVTARKRAEDLQTVPDTITAFTQQQIDERRLYQIDDFLAITPNVRINNDQDSATNNISIRGLGSNRNQAAAVAFSIDGVLLPDADAFTMDLSDAERVEILKGPQGALYGKGSIAGVINITTRKPTNELEAAIKASYSSGENYRVFGAVSGPIVEDKLFARVTGSYLNKEGTIENAFDGEGLDHDENYKLSGRLVFEPSESISFDLNASYYDQSAGSLWFNLSDIIGNTGGRITQSIAKIAPNMDGDNRSERQIFLTSLTAEFDIGAGVLTSITAYDDINFQFFEDLDASPFPLVPFTQQIRNTEAYSQELRFTSPDENRFRYIVGGYFQHSERNVISRATFDACLFFSSCVTPGGIIPSGATIPLELANTIIDFDQYAVFGQASYDVLDNLELTGALRYDIVKGKQRDTLAVQIDEDKFSELQPKVSIAYLPTEELTLYATFARGFKSGNFNPVSAGPGFPRIVVEETSTNFEIGTKTEFFERKVLFNAAAFLTKHNNPQIFQLDPVTVGQGTLNANEVKIKGFEFELQSRPVEGFSLNASVGYTDSEIVDFDGSGRYVGQQLPNAPQFTLNLGADYTHSISDAVVAKLRFEFFGVGKQSFQDFQNPNPDEFLFQNSYGTFDGQFGISTDNWALTLFAKNIFDRRYATSAFSRWIFPVAFLPLNSDAVQPDPGRILGVELRSKF